MSNSSLVVYTKISPNKTSPRKSSIDTITIHCMAGDLSVEACGAMFALSSTEASSNYGIGSDGRVALYVDEGDRSWASSNSANDHRAVTIEVASDKVSPYAVSDAAYSALIDLCVDICQRNGIKKLLWQADSSLIGQVEKQNMTAHRWFANKACPGDYLYSRFGDIAEKVNARLEDDEEVTQDQFNAMMETYLASLRAQTVSSWASDSWAKATAAGVFDGTAPQTSLSREQAALVLDRLGLIEG